MAEIHKGKCLCGKISYQARGSLRGVVYCHCSQCRRQSGHFYAATNVENDQLEVSGNEHIRWYQSSDQAQRGFCSNCGSALFWKIEGRGYTSINAGSFDTPTDLKAEMHIFVADKGDYYEINDGLPQFERSHHSVKVAGD